MHILVGVSTNKANNNLNVNHKYIVTLQCPLPIENLGILIKNTEKFCEEKISPTNFV